MSYVPEVGDVVKVPAYGYAGQIDWEPGTIKNIVKKGKRTILYIGYRGSNDLEPWDVEEVRPPAWKTK
jgi:hypothetical protein